MFDLPVPVISIITGNCLGVGLFFVCAADVAIVDETAKLQVLDAGLGYYPGMALPFLLERKVGVQQASLLTMTQEAISAREAERFGLVARCLVAGSAFDEGMRLARAIAAAAPEVVNYIKWNLQVRLKGSCPRPRMARPGKRKTFRPGSSVHALPNLLHSEITNSVAYSIAKKLDFDEVIWSFVSNHRFIAAFPPRFWPRFQRLAFLLQP